MSTGRTSSTARARACTACVPLLFLLLGGLLAMHALDVHGVDPAAAGTPMSAVHTMRHGVPISSQVDRADAAPGTTTLADPATSHGAMAMAGTCVAVLVGIVLSLLAGRRAAGRIPVPVLLHVPTARPRGRDRDPPSLTALSVRRC